MSSVGSTPDGDVFLSHSDDGRVATILLDRAAKLNALTLPMLDRLREVSIEAGRSRARVVLIRTAGEKVFSVGADINHFSDLNSVGMWRTWIATGHAAFAAVQAIPQPTVAVVDGLAYGGGFELALATDLRVLGSTVRVALPETGLGTVPGWGGTQRLAELIGVHRTKELVFTRRVLSAEEALTWGIATRLADEGDLEPELDRLVTELLGSAPVAVQLAKQIIDGAAAGAPSSTLEALASGVAAATGDLAEGVAAFREKRPPDFSDS